MFETDRLIIRKFVPDDTKGIFAMRQNPRVMRYIREPQTRIESTLNWLEMISRSWANEGFGFCAVVEKESNQFIGWCGLWILKETKEIEIGYAIKPTHWSRGFATEAAAQFLQFGFECLKLPLIVAVCYPENDASQKVMQKLGMEYIGYGKFYGANLLKYAITKEDWKILGANA